eukprot:Nitzschia sp. Nitz4//scaffold7_size249615//427//1548//NITZ4_001131-RA/size249615-processed-gene-0.167-mRNA-1//-1//CDS//3329558304//7689//frame0
MTVQEPLDVTKLRDAVDEAKALEIPEEQPSDDELEALAEIVPDLKSRKGSMEHIHGNGVPATAEAEARAEEEEAAGGDRGVNTQGAGETPEPTPDQKYEATPGAHDSSDVGEEEEPDINEVLYGGDPKDDANSDEALSSNHSKPRPPGENSDNLAMGEYPHIPSGASLSTATQTHEVRMPMYLPTFKPATGCTNASDFIVRCFVARLRSGITVVKHGRSRWCKSRLRILHIHPDGRSLSWKPAQGEPTSSKRPPKLDLTTCLEVRHAWSPDPQNPMYTGSPILRQKCEAANAHKSFALIFPRRTVDITSVTADQCKVLMEGFSALCFRLQVANLAGKGNKKAGQKMPDEEEVATTASVTLTNNSTTVSPHTRR